MAGAWTPASLAGVIDHTCLRPEAGPADIDRLCREARELGFATVCVNGVWIARAAAALRGSGVGVCGVIGFPLGAMAPLAKAQEARLALADGARELDMVLQVGALLAGDHGLVAEDIAGVVAAARGAGARVKVILETALLDDGAKRLACRLALAAGADFVKTSTGFAASGASPEDVALLRAEVGQRAGVKASGGIRDLAGALAMLAAGANRLGTSGGPAIVREAVDGLWPVQGGEGGS